jgi:hypothetical protein
MATEAVESNYSDPSNMEEILEELRNAATLGEVNNLINRVFPNWQVCMLSGFCEGYPHLNANWEILCKKMDVAPTRVLIVRDLSFDDDHLLLRNFVECLTRAGFVVKRMVDYVPCRKCEKIAIPTPPVHNVMKEKGVPVPDVNVPICKGCM